MQLDKFTIKSQEALQTAQQIAHQHSHQEVDVEHLLLALVTQPETLIPALLQKLGISIPRLTSDLEAELGRRSKVQGTSSADVFLGRGLKKALDAAQVEATKLKDDYVSAEHLLLGMLDEGGAALKKLFQTHALKRDDVLKALVDLRGNQRVTDAQPEAKFQAL